MMRALRAIQVVIWFSLLVLAVVAFTTGIIAGLVATALLIIVWELCRIVNEGPRDSQ